VDGGPQWSREWSRKLTNFATNIVDAGAGLLVGGRVGQVSPGEGFMLATMMDFRWSYWYCWNAPAKFLRTRKWFPASPTTSCRQRN